MSKRSNDRWLAARMAKVKAPLSDEKMRAAAEELANQLRPTYPLVSVGLANECQPGAALHVYASTRREEQHLRTFMTSAGWTHKGYPVVVKYMGKVTPAAV